MFTAAVMTDAHANLPALEAALDVICRIGYDVLYHTGDAIGIGPHPRETLELLLETPRAHLLMGNHELRYLNGMPREQPDAMTDLEFQHVRWMQRVLGPDYRTAVRRFPRRIERTIYGRRLCFLHYAPGGDRWDLHPVVEHPTPAQLDAMFAGCHADLVFYGHHHPPADHTGRARYINPGALGCSVDGRARFVLLHVAEDGTYRLEKRTVLYNRQAVLQDLERRRVPGQAFISEAFFGSNKRPN
ncbi:MAG: metallophosphoesterase family protein [Anaerolineae bacterium]